MRERGRLLERERERNTDVPKLYAYNECGHSVRGSFILRLTYIDPPYDIMAYQRLLKDLMMTKFFSVIA